MTRKEKRNNKQMGEQSSAAPPIAFYVNCTLGHEEVKSCFYNKDFKQLASDIMEIATDKGRAVGELQRLKHMWDLLFDREDLEELCEEEVEYSDGELQTLYDKITMGLELGQGTTLYDQMRMELLQMLLSFLLPNTSTACCFGTCCDTWIEALEDDNEDNT